METNRYQNQNIRREDRGTLIALEKGKLPPQAIELEEAILGALMIDKKSDDLFDVFTDPEVFYKDAHQAVFKAIIALHGKGEPVDMLTVSAQLKAMGLLERAGGDIFLIQLTQKISSSAHIEFHGRIVLQKYMQRKAIRIASELIERAYDNEVDVFETLDFAEMELSGISEMISKGKSVRSWHDLLKDVLKNVEMLSNKTGDILGVTTGFYKLDAMLGGWRPTNFYVIGARPGAGKTALTVASMIAAAQAGNPVGYLSLEMSDVQLATRGVAVKSSFHMNQLTNTGFEHNSYFQTLIALIDQIKDLPIHIDDNSTSTSADLKRKARRMVRKFNIKILFFDYLQLAAGGGKDVRYNVNDLAYACKVVAKELNIAVIGLSQLSRDVDSRTPPRPRLSDLKESSAIEEAADMVGFLYRPGYYGLEPDSQKLDPNENTEFIIEKHRNGGLGTVGLWFEANKTKFMDEAPEPVNEATPVDTRHLPTAAQAFDAPVNTNPDDDMPF